MSSLLQDKGIDASANNHSYSGHELPRIVTGVNLYDVFASNWMAALLGRAVSMLPLPNARIKDEEPCSQRDIAAFVVDSTARISPAPLADCRPGVGEPIWLVAKPESGQQQRTIAATVVEQTDTTFIFRYLDATAAMPRFTSGAPLVNRAGEVVAINVGFGTLDGRRFGHGNHVASIRRHLELT
jgi:Trypsin-like peptidase domain